MFDLNCFFFVDENQFGLLSLITYTSSCISIEFTSKLPKLEIEMKSWTNESSRNILSVISKIPCSCPDKSVYQKKAIVHSNICTHWKSFNWRLVFGDDLNSSAYAFAQFSCFICIVSFWFIIEHCDDLFVLLFILVVCLCHLK